MAQEIVVLITTPSVLIARKIGQNLVKERLAACTNIILRVDSIFKWKNRICREREVLMIIKTSSGRFQKIVKRVKQLHPYTVPEIIALPIIKGSESYLKWVRQMSR